MCGHHLPSLAGSGHLQPLAATCSHLQPPAATCSHLQPLAATRVAASGRKWPQVAARASGRKWPQVAASGRSQQVAASGRKRPQVTAPSEWRQVAASGRSQRSGRKWPLSAISKTTFKATSLCFSFFLNDQQVCLVSPNEPRKMGIESKFQIHKKTEAKFLKWMSRQRLIGNQPTFSAGARTTMRTEMGMRTSPWWSRSRMTSAYINHWLVVWNIFLFFYILGIIIPTDFHIFQRGRYTTNQIISI